MDTALATAIHDPGGHLASGILEGRALLEQVFCGFSLNVSTATAGSTLAALETFPRTRLMRHEPDETCIGRFRRDAVLGVGAEGHVLYSDIDHVLRWLHLAPGSLREALAHRPEIDLLVVGRSASAMERVPFRLRETERLINHVYCLMTGKAWDLLFAIRRLSPRAVDLIANTSRVDTLANDVEWPLLCEHAGLELDFWEDDALVYRNTEAFGHDADALDGDAEQWIRRLEFAGDMASAVRPFLPGGKSQRLSTLQAPGPEKTR